MKRMCLTLMLFFAASIVVVGCQKKKECLSFAPSEKEISWTDYNTVGEVWDYFGCYQETAKEHYRDTMKVVGYIIPGTKGIVGPFDYESHITSDGLSIHLGMGDYYDIPCNKQHLVILYGYLGDNMSNDSAIMSKFREYQYGQKVYATLIILSRSTDTGCCDYLVCRPIEIEIIKMEAER